MKFADKKCVPCEGETSPMEYGKIKELTINTPTWSVVEEYKIWRLKKDYKFKDFTQAMKFVNKVAEIAEKEGHHPNIFIHDWNQIQLEIYTHKIRGLHGNDFILAAKIDTIET